jgi:hypothetical protein
MVGTEPRRSSGAPRGICTLREPVRLGARGHLIKPGLRRGLVAASPPLLPRGKFSAPRRRGAERSRSTYAACSSTRRTARLKSFETSSRSLPAEPPGRRALVGEPGTFFGSFSFLSSGEGAGATARSRRGADTSWLTFVAWSCDRPPFVVRPAMSVGVFAPRIVCSG